MLQGCSVLLCVILLLLESKAIPDTDQPKEASWLQNILDMKRSPEVPDEEFWGIRGKRDWTEPDGFYTEIPDIEDIDEKRSMKPNSLFGNINKKSLKPNSLFANYGKKSFLFGSHGKMYLDPELYGLRYKKSLKPNSLFGSYGKKSSLKPNSLFLAYGKRSSLKPNSLFGSYSKKSSLKPNSLFGTYGKRSSLKPNSLFGTYGKKSSLKPNSLFGTYGKRSALKPNSLFGSLNKRNAKVFQKPNGLFIMAKKSIIPFQWFSEDEEEDSDNYLNNHNQEYVTDIDDDENEGIDLQEYSQQRKRRSKIVPADFDFFAARGKKSDTTHETDTEEEVENITR